MPFFEKAQHFSIHGGEMNDVRGNYTRNETRTTANNNGSYNQYNASTVAMGNREVQTAAMGTSHRNNTAYGNGKMMVGVNMASMPPEVANMLQNLQLPTGKPNISGFTTHTSTMMQRGPQYAAAPQFHTTVPTPPSDISQSLAFLAGISVDSWTPEMVAKLNDLMSLSESVTQGKGTGKQGKDNQCH